MFTTDVDQHSTTSRRFVFCSGRKALVGIISQPSSAYLGVIFQLALETRGVSPINNPIKYFEVPYVEDNRLAYSQMHTADKSA